MAVLVTVQCPEGKSAEQINNVLVKVADALSEALNEKPEHIRVSYNEVKANRFCFGGTMFSAVTDYLLKDDQLYSQK